MLNCFVFLSLLCCVFGVRGEGTTVSVKEGESVTLHTGVTKPQHDTMRWYFNNTLIALINGDNSTSCLYDGEGRRFRDRLKVDYESGSLNITNTRSEHTGHYEVQLIRGESSGKRQSLNRNSKCNSTRIIRKTSSTDDIIKTFRVTVSVTTEQNDPDQTNEESGKEGVKQDPEKSLSSGAVAGIVIGVLLVSVAVAVGVIYYHHRRSRNGL